MMQIIGDRSLTAFENIFERLLKELLLEVTEDHALNRGPPATLKIRNDVLRFFVENAEYVPEINVACLRQILDLAQRHPDDWQNRARATFRTAPRHMTIPDAPIIRPVKLVSPRFRDKIIHGRFEDHVHELPDQCIDLVLTSPSYAMQRAKEYGGIPEKEYPQWASYWMGETRRLLKPHGNVVIILGSIERDGRTSDYDRRTVERLVQDGWIYCRQMIWVKPDSLPLGNPHRPRCSYEPIHWFALDGRSYCNPRAGGPYSARIGLTGRPYAHGLSDGYRNGIARARDVFTVCIGNTNRPDYIKHPATFPVALAEQLIMMFSPRGGVVLDPFIGSGTTAVAAVATGRHFIGVEMHGRYVNMARRWIKESRQ